MKEIFDHAWYSEKFLKILPKSGDIIPLSFNVFQKKFAQVIRKMRDTNRPARVIILKCRQVGGSTFGTSAVYHETATEFYSKGMVIAHDIESTNNLFQMCKRYYQLSPKEVRPMKRYSNEKALVFENPEESSRDENSGLMSSIHVGTAGKDTAGRSGTYKKLHISELPFWKNAGTVVTGLIQAVPLTPDSLVIIEGTANGMEGGDGEEFYRRWNKAVSGESDYIPIFCAWWENPEYEMNPKEGMRVGSNPERYGDEKFEFEFLMDPKPFKVGETVSEKGFSKTQALRKLAWRRYKIDNDMGSDLMAPLDQWNQEYPLTPEHAFISSGRPVFSQHLLKHQITELENHPPETKTPPVTLSEDAREGLVIFEMPHPEKVYAMGVDVSEGVEGGDASDIRILDKEFNEVARWHGLIDADIVGEISAELGWFYNTALVAIEVNNMGIASLKAAQRKKYTRFYTRMVKEERADGFTKKIGWRTDVKTKREMLVDLKKYHRDEILKVRDVEALKEFRKVTREANGDVIITGKDRVAAFAIACQAVSQAKPNYHPVARPTAERKKPPATAEEWIRAANKRRKKGTDGYFD